MPKEHIFPVEFNINIGVNKDLKDGLALAPDENNNDFPTIKPTNNPLTSYILREDIPIYVKGEG